MMSLLEDYKVEDVGELHISKDVNYTSRKTAHELLKVFADDVDEDANKEFSRACICCSISG